MNVNIQTFLINLVYNIFMKRLFILSFLFMYTCISSFAAGEGSMSRKDAYNNMIKSHQSFHEICADVADNFRIDHKFSGYLRQKCMFFESDRQRLIDSIFPITNLGDDEYKTQYPILVSNFAIASNDKQLQEYKFLVEEYCKYNKYKYVKKDPQACSAERINAIFEH